MTALLSLALTPWGPVVLLLLGAVALFPVNVRRLPRAVQAVTVGILGVAWLWTMLWRLSPAPVVSAEVTRAPLGIAVYALFKVNPTTWPFAAVVMTVGLIGALLWPMRPPAGRLSGPSVGLVFIAGALLMTIAGNLLALFLGWVFMDAAYLALLLEAHPRSTGRGVGLTLLGTLLLWGIIALLPTETIVQPWEHLVVPGWAQAVLALSVWLRLGAYPLHRPRVLPLPGFPAPWLWLDIIAGGSWLARWAWITGAEAFWHHKTWLAVAVFAFFGSALVAWLSPSVERRVEWAMIQRVGVLLLLPLAASPPWDDIILSLTLAVTLAGGALLTLRHMVLPFAQRIVSVLAALILWGLPLTAGAPVRLVLAGSKEWHVGLGILFILADALVLGALLFYGGEEQDSGGWQGVLRVAMLLSPTVLIPPLLSLPQIPLTTWAWTTILPLTLGMLIAWQYERIFISVREWVWSLEVLAYLHPVEVGARNATGWLLTALGGIFSLLEGGGWLGWALLFGLVLLLW